MWNRNDPRLSSLKHPRKVVRLPSGAEVMYGGFFPILVQGTTVSKETEYRYTLCEEGSERGEASTVKMVVYAYRGSGQPPAWMDEQETGRESQIRTAIWSSLRNIPDLFSKVCTIKSDSELPNTQVSGWKRKSFWRTTWEVVVKFGGTELQAQIAWRENVSIVVSPNRGFVP